MKLDWALTSSAGIRFDEQANAWHSGHVEALLLLESGTLLVGTDTGGVWLLDEGAVPPRPLSHEWNNPDVRCLAQGWGGPNHVFAGCLGGLYETDLSSHDPLGTPWRQVDLGGTAGSVFKIVLLSRARIIVLATDQGLSWSPFPVAAGSYAWKAAKSLPFGAYGGLAVTTNEVVVAAANPGGGENPGAGHYGLFRAGLIFGDLIAVSIPAPHGLDALAFGRTSVASCRDRPERLYAVISDPANDNHILAVIRSDDSSDNWRAVAVPDNASHQGDYNNDIGVSPLNPDLLAIAWSSAGPMVSRDGGLHWETIVSNSPHWHADQHAVLFDASDETQNRLYFGTDGGVVLTPDLGRSFTSLFNRFLPTLQFASHPARRGLYGTFAGRNGPPLVVGGGTQDNGDMFFDPTANAWRELRAGDGHGMMYVANGDLVWYVNDGSGTHAAQWARGGFQDLGAIPNTTKDLIMAPLARPRYRTRDNQALMLGAGGQSGKILGLFQAGGTRNLFWRQIGEFTSLPDVLGVGGYTGETVFVSLMGTPVIPATPGTEATPGRPPRLFALDSASGNTVELFVNATFDLTSSGAWEIDQIVITDDATGFATVNNQTLGDGFLLKSSDLLEWARVAAFPGGQGMLYGLDADWAARPGEVYAVTDGSVWMSSDSGLRWTNVTDGLPTMPHCSGVQLITDFRGDPWLHVPTYGRSVWRARLGGTGSRDWPVGGWFRTSPVGTAPVGAVVAAVARNPGQLDVFIAGNDGGIYTGWWNPAIDWPVSGWRRISPTGTAPVGAAVAALARNPDQLDVFISGHDGGIYNGWWNPATDWPVGGWRRISPTGTAPVGAPVAAVARNADQIDVFIVGHDGGIFSGWWNSVTDWPVGGWRRISPVGTAPVGARIAAVSRNPNQLDVFIVGNDGGIYTGWWNPSGDWPVAGWRRISPVGTAPAGAPIAAVSRNPNQLDVFIVGHDGGIYNGWWNPSADWHLAGWRRVSPVGTAPVGALVAAVSRDPDHMDVFIVGNDGGIYTGWWSSAADWPVGGWRRISPVDTAPAGGPIAAVSPNTDELDVFITGHDGGIYTGWWSG